MTILRNAGLTLLTLASLSSPAAAQSVVDQGTFSIEIDGSVVGTEEFKIRRVGFNRSAIFIADGVVALGDESGSQEIRHLLRVSGSAGAAEA